MNTHTAHDEIARLEAGLKSLQRKYSEEALAWGQFLEDPDLLRSFSADLDLLLGGLDVRGAEERFEHSFIGDPPKPVSEWTEQECRDWLDAHPVPITNELKPAPLQVDEPLYDYVEKPPKMPPGDDPRGGDPIPSLYSPAKLAKSTTVILGMLAMFAVGILVGMLL